VRLIMRLNIAKRIPAVAAALFLLWAGGGCARPQPASVPGGEMAPGQAPQAPAVKGAPAKEPAYFIYTVKWPNESLSIIAAWYTGQIDNWKALAKVNPELDPNRINIGDKIRIPEELMKTHNPPTQEFVDSLVPKPKKPHPTKETSPEPELKLYGPKTTN
jgi:LysM repeat protein